MLWYIASVTHMLCHANPSSFLVHKQHHFAAAQGPFIRVAYAQNLQGAC